MKQEYYSTKEVAEIEGISERRVLAKIKQGFHYPNAKKVPVVYGWKIPKNEVKKTKD